MESRPINARQLINSTMNTFVPHRVLPNDLVVDKSNDYRQTPDPPIKTDAVFKHVTLRSSRRDSTCPLKHLE